MSDLDIGMNDWMVPATSKWDDSLQARTAARCCRRRGAQEDARSSTRYLDVDGDGIAYAHAPRRLAARARTSCAARATTSMGSYTEDSDRVSGAGGPAQARKFEGAAASRSPSPVISATSTGAEVGLVTIGGCRGRGATRRADILRAERHPRPTTCASAAFPFSEDVRQASSARHEHIVRDRAEPRRAAAVSCSSRSRLGVARDSMTALDPATTPACP